MQPQGFDAIPAMISMKIFHLKDKSGVRTDIHPFYWAGNQTVISIGISHGYADYRRDNNQGNLSIPASISLIRFVSLRILDFY